MPELRSPKQVLAAIPGWEAADSRPIDGGQTNAAWLVCAGKRRGVLKIDREPRPFPFRSRSAEAEVQRRAAARGLANDVLFATDTVLLTEYQSGRVLDAADLREPATLASVAALLRSVHAMRPCGAAFDALRAGELYAATARQVSARRADESLATLRAIGQAASAVCCHNDVVVGNLLDARGLRLLDWEYAADNDPLFDVATVAEHHGLDRSATDSLLDAYGASDREAFEAQRARYRALYWLWRASRS